MNVPLLIAEVMDKEPPIRMLLVVSVAIAGTAFIACRWSRWLLIVFLPLSVLIGVGSTSEVRDPFVGPAIQAEAGWSYVVLAYVGAVLPGVASVAGAYLQWRRMKIARTQKNKRLEGNLGKSGPSNLS